MQSQSKVILRPKNTKVLQSSCVVQLSGRNFSKNMHFNFYVHERKKRKKNWQQYG
jgi:hypothetical protein